MSCRENVPCCINVAVVFRSATASPFSFGQNIVFEKFSRGHIRRMVNIPAVRYVDMTVTTERDKIRRVKPNVWVVGPSFDVMDMQSHTSPLAKGACVVVPAFDLSGKLSELISEHSTVRTHRDIFGKTGFASLLLRPVVHKSLSALSLQTPAGFRVAGNGGPSMHLSGVATVTSAGDARITVLRQNNQSSEAQPDDWFSISRGCRCCHRQKVLASAPEASA